MANPQAPEIDFGPIAETEEDIHGLWDFVHSHSRLQKAGYVLWPLGQAGLDKKKRCGRCTKVIRKGHEKQKSRAQSVKLAPTIAQRIAAEAGAYPRPGKEQRAPAHARSISLQANGADMTAAMQDVSLNGDSKDGKNGKDTGPPMNCKFHPGRIQYRVWTCCGNNIGSAPCAAEQFHSTRVYRRGELESNWEYFTTPHPAAAPGGGVVVAVDAEGENGSSTTERCAVVVLDCEMGTAASGESELIRVSAVDFFSCRVLVDSLVWPDVKMAHFNTRYSGVTRQSMEAAYRARRTLAGRAGAREALWKFVGPQTIVVGHSANSDLNSLRWIHPMVIDTLLLEMRIQPREEREERDQKDAAAHGEDAAEGEQQQQQQQQPESPAKEKKDKSKYPGLSLKALTAERLQREIQTRGQGHDSLEDALATRDLLLWHLRTKPQPPVIY